MSNQVLQMKYHPAKKEIMFRRFQSGEEVPIRNDSRLKPYMNKKGQFVLQNYGKKFFDDIVYAFSGEKEIAMEVITTKGDFDDFEAMVEYYNEGSKTKITAKLIAELPDMKTTYEAVKKHGKDAMEILKQHRRGFFDVPLGIEEVKKCVDNFANEVLDAAGDIEKKINSLEQNTVNICFSGVFSSGKSMLINSLLGYSVLPENIMPETAAMFTIKSPEKGSSVRTVFDIRAEHSEIVWNERNSIFEFVAGPTESDCRKRIQEKINENKEEPRHAQLKCILDILNKEKDDVSRNIDVYFPIRLDSDRLQFTIFDTPGTDSGDDEHQRILQDALAEQTHSILVFVISPDSLKGGGNRILLKYLDAVEKKEEKAVIDLGRSLFVINKADTLMKDAEFQKLKQADIEDDSEEIESIRLADKKLFFTSASFGYAAQAVKNGIATEDEEFLFKQDRVTDPKHGCYYRHDQCATSDIATNNLLSKCDQEFRTAMSSNNRSRLVWVASGLYALQNEIITYGEKYASAVKTYSIIDSVDKALARLNKNALSLEQQNEEDIKRIDQEIQEIKNAVTESIKAAYGKFEFPEDRMLPEEVLKELELDSESLAQFVNDGKTKLGKIVKRILWIFKKEWDSKDKSKIAGIIYSIVNDYTERFKENRKKILESTRDEFIKEIKKAMEKNGGLSSEAKEYVSNIVPPEINDFEPGNNLILIYDKCREFKGFWIFEHQVVDDKKFMEKADMELKKIAEELFNDYEKKYRDDLTSLCKKVEDEFISNMEKYNVMLSAKAKDKETMKLLKTKIAEAAKALENCQKKLDEVIWKESE